MAFKFEPNPKGIAELLRLPRVLADLENRAQRVAAAANAAPTSSGNPEPLRYEVRSETGRRRARAAVVAASARTNAHEHKHHTLARVLDHAR